MKNKSDKLSTGLSGLAGEYFVAAELTRRGFLASIMLRNTKGIDILAATSDTTRTISIQVKTNQNSDKSWVLNKKSEDIKNNNFFYILVNLETKSGYPDFHIVPSEVISRTIADDHSKWLSKPGKKGQKRVDNTIRKFKDTDLKYLNRWDLLISIFT
ncbi:MAG: hypothetical protein ACK41T_06535 [Pseudobdellovibrio sp.]